MSLIFEQFDPPTTCAEADMLIMALRVAAPKTNRANMIDIVIEFLPSLRAVHYSFRPKRLVTLTSAHEPRPVT